MIRPSTSSPCLNNGQKHRQKTKADDKEQKTKVKQSYVVLLQTSNNPQIKDLPGQRKLFQHRSVNSLLIHFLL